MSAPITDQLRLYFNSQRDSTIRLFGAFGEKLTAEQREYANELFAPLNERLNKLDVINDSDGMKTAVESIIELQKLLSEDGSLKDVLGSLKTINDTLKAHEKRLLDTETVANRADEVSTTNALNIGKLQESIIKYNSDLAKSIEDKFVASKKYTDDELVKIREEITKAVNEGGEAVVALKKRVKITEEALFDTEVDGVVVKGISTRLKELEAQVKQNATIAKEQANEALAQAKEHTDTTTVQIEDIKAVAEDIKPNENIARKALGLDPIEV